MSSIFVSVTRALQEKQWSVSQLMNESSREERTQEEKILRVSSLKFRDSLEAKKCDGGRHRKILGDFALALRVSGHVLLFV
jgi:hypothetical protein